MSTQLKIDLTALKKLGAKVIRIPLTPFTAGERRKHASFIRQALSLFAGQIIAINADDASAPETNNQNQYVTRLPW